MMNLNKGTTSPFPNAAQGCAHPQVRRLKNSPVMNQLQDHPECKRLACLTGAKTWMVEIYELFGSPEGLIDQQNHCQSFRIVSSDCV